MSGYCCRKPAITSGNTEADISCGAASCQRERAVDIDPLIGRHEEVERTVQILQQARHQRVKLATRFRKAHLACAAVDQLHAQGLLNLLDQAAEGRLGHMQTGGCIGKTARVGQSHKGPQLAQRDIHKLFI